MVTKSKKDIENSKPAKPKIFSNVPWGPITAVLVAAVIFIGAELIGSIIISVYPLLRHLSHQQASDWLNNSAYAQFWLTVIIETLLISFLAMFIKYKKSSFKAIGLKGYPDIKDVGYVLVGFLMYFVTYVVVLSLLEHTTKINVNQKQDIGVSSSTQGPVLILVFISLVVLPPIAEEIFFRGFLYSGLRTKLPKIIAALITSALFASLHLLESGSGLLWVAGVDTFILSLVLVFLREKTGKLWSSMGLHMLKNFIAFAALFIFHVS